ncbi:MAG: TnpV protein [Lachnospiraceae bacterium]|nr:TnpV protein [Lachnospiraceae bacterium]
MGREPLAKLEYRKGEDGMLYPDLRISENSGYDRSPAGMFGKRWKDYMMSKHPQRLSELIALGQVNEMITRVDQEAERKKEALIQQLLEVQPMPETEDTLERAGHMEMITRQAEEIVLQEVVYLLR